MKRIVFIALLLTGCWGHSDSITGTYTNKAFIGGAAVYDTVQVSLVHSNGYIVIRRHRVKKRGGVYRVTRWTGEYNGHEQTLQIRENGRVLYFTNGALLMGKVKYKKQ
jgi:hypothetical protein